MRERADLFIPFVDSTGRLNMASYSNISARDPGGRGMNRKASWVANT